jgi:integrase/recombinase XerD
MRGYRSDFTTFETWCEENGRSSLPAATDTVAAFVDANATRVKPSTLKRLCSIRKLHRLLSLPCPLDNEEVNLSMRRASRKQLSRPAQAYGVTANLRDKMIAVCSDDLTGLRDALMISIGFDMLGRRGEIVALAIGDLTLGSNGRYTALVRRAKNDPEGVCRLCKLSEATSRLIERWLLATDIDRGALLRPVFCSVTVSRHLTPFTVSRVIKKLASRVEELHADVASVSGHFLRVGAAQQFILNGYGILPIMRAGGWRSMNTVARYIEHVDIDVWE